MRKTTLILLLGITMVFLSLNINAAGRNISIQTYNILITEETEKITVNETLKIKGETGERYETLSFWIPTEHSNLKILVDTQEIDAITPQSQNMYMCNLSSLNISADTIIEIKINYNLKTDVTEFQKTLTYNTSKVTIDFNGEQIYTGTNLLKDTIFTVKLTKGKTTIVTEKADYSIYYYVILLLVIIIIVLLYSRIKQSSETKVKKQIPQITSEELLTTKKALLLEVLKEIEKKHRAKKISEETYHKLKEQYKQEAVETMKQLDDIKSKIK